MPPWIEVIHQVCFVDPVVLPHLVIQLNPLRFSTQVAMVIFVANCQVEQVLADMPVDLPGVIGCVKPVRLTLLGGNVADVISFGAARQDCIRKPPHQQVRQQAGVQAARTDQDQICVQDCRGGWRIGRRFGWIEPDLQDLARVVGQLCLTPHFHDLLGGFILHFADKLNITQS